MSVFSYNYYKNLKRPTIYLAYPNKYIIGTLQVHNFETDIIGNSMNKGSFIMNRYEDGEELPYYKELEIGRYLLIFGVGWFRVKDIQVINNGLIEHKEINYISLEYELSQKNLEAFGSLGISIDEQGGLDRYCLYNTSDIEHSILHIVVEKSPDWSIKYVDPKITQEYRSFDIDSIDIYSFLTTNASEAYDCIFIFDSDDKTIAAYSLDSLGKDTNITLSYRNFIKNINESASEDDVKTVLSVIGGNDSRTNSPLGIIDVNISGTNQIYDFSYYHTLMSTELKTQLDNYEKKCKQNSTAYQNQLNKLTTLYQELNTLKNHTPDKNNSQKWAEYGLTELQAEEQKYWNLMSVNTNQYDSVQKNYYDTYYKIHSAIESEIGNRKKSITAKEAEIKSCIAKVEGLVIRLNDFLGTDLYHELQAFVHEDVLTDDSFIATTIMNNAEILDMQRSLLEHARKQLHKVCYPKFETTIDLINFTVNYDFKKFTDQLEMFNIIHIRYDKHDIVVDARLLKMHINWDNPNDFSVSFSNRNSLDETFDLLEEIRNQAQSTATSLGYQTGAFRDAASISPEISEYMNSVLDASKQQLVSNDNNEVRIDESGILIRKWKPDSSKYDPCQLWITNGQLCITQTAWETVGLALGYVKMDNDYFFGLAADKIVGNMILSKSLVINNKSGTYTITDNGLLAKNGAYQVKINPNKPSEIFSISIDNKNLLYVDSINKKLKFEGDIECKSGHIANFVISGNSLTSGKIGLCSDTASGSIAFWAGNKDKTKAPFRVNNNGQVECSNLNVTGGTISITDKFKVKEDGTLFATGADINGKITATSGKIGGWQIENKTLRGVSGDSYIEGGQINMGEGFFVADDISVELGEFEVIETSRGVFQSKDEVTGMSSETNNKKKWYLWAGYGHGSGEEALFLVNGAQVRCGGDLYVKGINILEKLNSLSGSGCKDCDDSGGIVCNTGGEPIECSGGECSECSVGCSNDSGGECGPGWP